MFKQFIRTILTLFFLLAISQKYLFAIETTKRNLTKEYFVILKEKPSLSKQDSAFEKNKLILDEIERKIENLGGLLIDRYFLVFVGTLAKLNSTSLNALKKDPRVANIVRNNIAYLHEFPDAVKSWGIDRIDQIDLPLDKNYAAPYSGANTHSYVIDTGLRGTHSEFTGRIGDGFNATSDNSSPFDDCNGHGTHVAGTVLGTLSGVAKESIIHPVKVFSCSGGSPWSVILKGMEWVIANHKKPAIINMSLGGTKNTAINTAVENTTNAGIHVVVSAGNSNAEACKYSPASAPSAITVASSTNTDARSGFSNKGSCVDLFAPGSAIISASNQADNDFRTLSGTSMSSPHVAGAVALALSNKPDLSPAEIEALLTSGANPGKISNPGSNTPNLLLFVNDFNKSPLVSAGEDQYIRLPLKEVTLIGKAADSDGYITESTWSQISGPSVVMASQNSLDWQQSLTIDNLILGTYVFRFEAIDDKGASSSDEVTVVVTKENITPIAKAGDDQKVKSIALVELDGSGSHDKDGSIVSYSWTQVSGPNEATIVDPTTIKTEIKNQIAGIYTFMLEVTDNEGAKSDDSIAIIINSLPNINAGDDQNIKLPTNKIILEGQAKDLDGSITTIEWSQTKGPSEATLITKKELITAVENLEIGSYIFTLKVTDDMGESVTDDITINVTSDNTPPSVSAGDDVTLILPENNVVLEGSCTDGDGQCISMTWELISKNFVTTKLATSIINSNLYLSDLEEGVYVFRLTGKDDKMFKSYDEVTVTVKTE